MEKNRRGVPANVALEGRSKNGSGRSASGGTDQPSTAIDEPMNPSRRSFLGRVGGAAAVAGTASSIMLKPLLGGKDSTADASTVGYGSGLRARECSNYKVNTAQAEDINVGVQPDNGDLAEFPDFSAMYSKALLHDSLALPNARSW